MRTKKLQLTLKLELTEKFKNSLILYFSPFSAGLIAAIENAATKIGPKAQPVAKKLEADVTAVSSAAKLKNGPETKQTLEKAAEDVKASEQVTKTKAPQLATLAERVYAQLKAFAAKFLGATGPFAQVDPLTTELTGQLKANTA